MSTVEISRVINMRDTVFSKRLVCALDRLVRLIGQGNIKSIAPFRSVALARKAIARGGSSSLSRAVGESGGSVTGTVLSTFDARLRNIGRPTLIAIAGREIKYASRQMARTSAQHGRNRVSALRRSTSAAAVFSLDGRPHLARPLVSSQIGLSRSRRDVMLNRSATKQPVPIVAGMPSQASSTRSLMRSLAPIQRMPDLSQFSERSRSTAILESGLGKPKRYQGGKPALKTPRSQSELALMQDASETLDFDLGVGPSRTSIQRAIETFFNAQARLPPAGITDFDPRLSPLWAGLQIPG